MRLVHRVRSPFLAVLTTIALAAAMAGPALAGHTIEIRNYDERAHGCEALGLDGFKIEARHLAEGEHTYEIYDNGNLLFTVTLDVSENDEGELDTLEDASDADPAVSVVLITAGSETTVWPDHPQKQAGGNREISHIEFCLGVALEEEEEEEGEIIEDVEEDVDEQEDVDDEKPDKLPDTAVGADDGAPVAPTLLAGLLAAAWLLLRRTSRFSFAARRR